jgi:hypothetical protein
MTRAVAAALRQLADALEASEPSPGAGDWISQAESPIGPRRHVALCRRLAAQGSPLACRAGRRFLLKPEAFSEAPKSGGKKASKPAPQSAAERAAVRLRRVG